MIIGACRVFQGNMPLIPMKLKELTRTSRKNPKVRSDTRKPPGKQMSLIGKGNERAKESHGEQPRGKSHRKDKAL
jgi:hypothetical protein